MRWKTFMARRVQRWIEALPGRQVRYTALLNKLFESMSETEFNQYRLECGYVESVGKYNHKLNKHTKLKWESLK